MGLVCGGGGARAWGGAGTAGGVAPSLDFSILDMVGGLLLLLWLGSAWEFFSEISMTPSMRSFTVSGELVLPWSAVDSSAVSYRGMTKKIKL